jgi:hypothetical protein
MPSDPDNLAIAEQAQGVVLQTMAERGQGLLMVGAARLDFATEHLLKAVMAPNEEQDDRLFTPDRSIGRFGAMTMPIARQSHHSAKKGIGNGCCVSPPWLIVTHFGQCLNRYSVSKVG